MRHLTTTAAVSPRPSAWLRPAASPTPISCRRTSRASAGATPRCSATTPPAFSPRRPWTSTPAVICDVSWPVTRTPTRNRPSGSILTQMPTIPLRYGPFETTERVRGCFLYCHFETGYYTFFWTNCTNSLSRGSYCGHNTGGCHENHNGEFSRKKVLLNSILRFQWFDGKNQSQSVVFCILGSTDQRCRLRHGERKICTYVWGKMREALLTCWKLLCRLLFVRPLLAWLSCVRGLGFD